MVCPVIYTGFQTSGVSHVQSLGLTVHICEMGVLGHVRRMDQDEALFCYLLFA